VKLVEFLEGSIRCYTVPCVCVWARESMICFSRYIRIKPGLVKGSWSKEEDDLILQMVRTHGKSWSKISKLLLTRNGKQIRDRFINVLDPEIKKGKFTEEEDNLLIKLYLNHGPRWARMAKYFPSRTADMIKNRFHSSIKKIFFGNHLFEIKSNSKLAKSLALLREKKKYYLKRTKGKQSAVTACLRQLRMHSKLIPNTKEL